MKKLFTITCIVFCYAVTNAQNVGIGTSNPTEKLEVNGTTKTNGLQIPTGASSGKILKTDANGVASWGSIDAAGLFNTPPPAQLSCPALTGLVSTATNPRSVAVAGNYAYVVNIVSNTLQVFNITNPVATVLAGSVTTGTTPISVVVVGNYAYVVNQGSNTLQIINITSPATPVVVGSAGTGTSPSSVVVKGSYAYVVNSGSNTLQVINITNPTSPLLTGSVSTGTGPISVTVERNYAYVVNNGSNNLQVINISNPAAPVQTGSIAVGSFPQSAAVLGNYAYVVNLGSNTLEVINISNPAVPVLTGAKATGTFPRSVVVVGNYAYVANGNSNTLHIFNISNPAAPVLEGSVVTGTNPRSVVVAGNYAYIVNATSNTMQVFNLACSQNFAAAYNPVTGQTTAIQLPWNTENNNIYNNNSGNVGIGITNALRAKLEVNGGVGRTVGIFGGEGPGLSLQKEFPAVGYNQYFDGTVSRHIGSGYAALSWFNPATGNLNFDMFPSGLVNATTVSTRAMTIANTGNIGIGGAATNGQLQLDNQLKNRKLVLYETANNNHQYYGFGIESGALRYNIDAPGAAHRFYAATGSGSSTMLMSIGGNQVIQMGSGIAKVGINTLPFAPATALEINGALSMRTALATVTNANPTITVGDRSYIYITSGQPNVVVFFNLSNGISAGQVLILESAADNNFAGVDLNNGPNIKMAGGGMRIRGEETMTLIWNGAKWIELCRSRNF